MERRQGILMATVITNTNEKTDWNISNDIYDIVESVNSLQKRYIEDENEATLALGLYGFLADTESKKIQTSVIMTGKLGNEMFPARAQLTKNVLTHAIYNNIPDINAVPAQIVFNMGIKVRDIDTYAVNNKFTVDCKAPIFIGSYEFHFDYDIIITRNNVSTDPEVPNYVYSAQYDMTVENKLSNIINQYLKQPFVIKIGNDNYVIFQSIARQCTIDETTDKVTSASLIENKTFIFDYTNQLAWFDVYITDANGNERRLTPFIEGQNVNNEENFCWYLFLDDNTIRIRFDSRSVVPALNSTIRIVAYTTMGSSGNFKYTKVDKTSEGYYIDIKSDKMGYNISTYVIAVTDSANGNNRKTKEQLQKLIPKAAMSRGSLTTEKDVDNYFNLIDDENNRLVLKKKVDNQLNRIWYGYFLLKDELGNIIPTNTIDLRINNASEFVILDDHGKYILPAGMIIRYNPNSMIGEVIDEGLVPDPYTDEYYSSDYYYYITIYNTIICPDPLFTGYTATITDKPGFFKFDWVNEGTPFQFVANRCNFQRKMREDPENYRFDFAIAQSIITQDYITYNEEIIRDYDTGTEYLNITNNVKTVLVLYNGDIPYRWVECEFESCDQNNYIFKFFAKLTTDNMLDSEDRLKLISTDEFPLHVAGYSDSTNYGYFDENIKAKIYVLNKFVKGEGSSAVTVKYNRYDFDDIAPDVFPGYSVTNVYEVNDGLQIYEHFTEIVNSRIDIASVLGTELNQNATYGIIGVPVVGYHYISGGEEYAQFLFDAIYDRKAYIDYCLTLLENNMDIDFKFFNTYGPSSVYSIGDDNYRSTPTMIGHVDLTMKFRVSIKSTADVITKDDLVKSIKAYIENLYDTGNWDAPNMITELMNEYSDRINFIEFMNYNDFWLGVQHIWKVKDENGIEVDDSPLVVPEFLNIRNILDNDGNMIPDIEIELI
jgi:hypothetical protein